MKPAPHEKGDRRTMRMRRILDNQVAIMCVLQWHVAMSHGTHSKDARKLLANALAETAKVQ
ncbi:hypothetical protein JQ608_06760 [Bradyrhizobium liaoningense]|nr:hypothetical protein [Bradyrhizobium liaoningense]